MFIFPLYTFFLFFFSLDSNRDHFFTIKELRKNKLLTPHKKDFKYYRKKLNDDIFPITPKLNSLTS